jgi:hypothetical protein
MPALRDTVSEETLFLLDFIIQKCFGGEIPDDMIMFAELVADWSIRQIPRETWEAIGSQQEIVRHNFSIQFLLAAESWRIAHETSVAAPWTN